MKRKTVMPGKVQKLTVEDDLRPSFDHNAFEIVITAPAGKTAHLPESFDVSFQKKLHRLSRIKPAIQKPAVGKNKNKAVSRAERKRTLHPIDLCFLAGKERQLVAHPFPFPAKRPCVFFDRGVPTRKTIGLQPVMRLAGFQRRVSLIPVFNQARILVEDAFARLAQDFSLPHQSGNFCSGQTQRIGHLANAQTFDFLQMTNMIH
ncbi:MAG: hypothetical protein GYA67_00025 [Smithella sp.]|jgi:hypothetical protein|nr:hypothetical protein [Smithella sp.]HPO21982.1 hypothetical protein [Smithellaceae bacterium]